MKNFEISDAAKNFEISNTGKNFEISDAATEKVHKVGRPEILAPSHGDYEGYLNKLKKLVASLFYCLESSLLVFTLESYSQSTCTCHLLAMLKSEKFSYQ